MSDKISPTGLHSSTIVVTLSNNFLLILYARAPSSSFILVFPLVRGPAIKGFSKRIYHVLLPTAYMFVKQTLYSAVHLNNLYAPLG